MFVDEEAADRNEYCTCPNTEDVSRGENNVLNELPEW